MNSSSDSLDNDDQLQTEEAKAKRQREIELDDLKWLLAHAQGRRIAGRILERAGVHRTTFNTNGSTMAFQEGRREMGLWFESETIVASLDGYMRVLKDYRNDRTSD